MDQETRPKYRNYDFSNGYALNLAWLSHQKLFQIKVIANYIQRKQYHEGRKTFQLAGVLDK